MDSKTAIHCGMSIQIDGRIQCLVEGNEHSSGYLEAKMDRMSHMMQVTNLGYAGPGSRLRSNTLYCSRRPVRREYAVLRVGLGRAAHTGSSSSRSAGRQSFIEQRVRHLVESRCLRFLRAQLWVTVPVRV
jgi:hypothetical protein